MVLVFIYIFDSNGFLGLFFVRHGEKIIPKTSISVKSETRFYPGNQHLMPLILDLGPLMLDLFLGKSILVHFLSQSYPA